MSIALLGESCTYARFKIYIHICALNWMCIYIYIRTQYIITQISYDYTFTFACHGFWHIAKTYTLTPTLLRRSCWRRTAAVCWQSSPATAPRPCVASRSSRWTWSCESSAAGWSALTFHSSDFLAFFCGSFQSGKSVENTTEIHRNPRSFGYLGIVDGTKPWLGGPAEARFLNATQLGTWRPTADPCGRSKCAASSLRQLQRSGVRIS